MKSPYEILAVATGATDSEIKQAYLQRVKDNPPDRNQAQFQMIADAYELIKDSKSRMSYELFSLTDAGFDDLLDLALSPVVAVPLNHEHLLKLLKAGIDDNTVLNLHPNTGKS